MITDQSASAAMTVLAAVEPQALVVDHRRISRDSTVPKDVYDQLKAMPRPKLGDYKVGDVLGTGTFGTVFVVKQRVRPPPPRRPRAEGRAGAAGGPRGARSARGQPAWRGEARRSNARAHARRTRARSTRSSGCTRPST